MNRNAAATAAAAALMPLLLLAGCGGAAVPESKDVSLTPAFTDAAAAAAACPALFGEANAAAKGVFEQDVASEWATSSSDTRVTCALLPIGSPKALVALDVHLVAGDSSNEIVSKSGAAIGYDLTESIQALTQDQGKRFQEWLRKAADHVKA